MRIYPPGVRIAGQYEVAGRPLMGGMGIVYVCFDHREGRPVALKTFKPEYLPDRAARDRFLREGTAWVDLGRHPHVVRCYEVVHTDPEVYLVLELIAKEQGRDDASLRAWLTPGTLLPVEQVLLFGLQIARGMAHAASVIPGFVHRDLKPENVLVGADRLSGTQTNRLRVTDFGLATVLQQAARHIGELPPNDKPSPISNSQSPISNPLGRTQLTHGVVGTPFYMAPEQWRGEEVTIAADVYALGCILFEMLAGQRAVTGRSLTALQRAHCQGEVRPLPTDLPRAVRALVTRCLAVEPGERYGHWEDVERELVGAYEEVAERRVPVAGPVTALSREERVAAGWSYNAMGVSYQDIGKAEVALGYFQRAQEVGEEEGERPLEGGALGNLGNTYADLGDARRAIGYFEQALIIHHEIGDRRGEGATLGNLGRAYADLGDARRAIEYYEQRLAIAREIGDRRGEGNALSSLGRAYLQLGDAQRAIGYYEQALIIHRESGDRRGEGNALGGLGSAYLQLGDVRRAIGYHEQQLVITREIGDRRGEGNALGSLGNAYADLGGARRAIGYFEQVLIIHREIGDRRGEGNALGSLGSAYLQLGDARRAIEYYEQRLAIAREIGDRRGEGATLSNLGSAYLQLGDAQRAIGYYEQALIIHRESGDRRREGAVLGNLGNAYADLGDVRRAIEHYEQQLVITREIGDRRGEGTALSNLGNAYADLGDARRAIEYFEQALAIANEIGDIDGMARHSFNMAILHEQQGESERALPLVQQAVEIWGRIGSPQVQRAQQLVAQLQGGSAATSGPTPAEILQQLDPIIAAVVAAARGNHDARAQVEALFDTLSRNDWHIVEPIQRIWAGERDEAALTAGIDPNSALIVRQILNQLR